MKASAILAISLLPLAAGGCAWMGRNTTTAAAGPDTATAAAIGFTQADVNGDARVSRSEFERWAEANPGEHGDFYSADTNLNGVLTLDEWQAMSRPSAAAGGTRASSPARGPGRAAR